MKREHIPFKKAAFCPEYYSREREREMKRTDLYRGLLCSNLVPVKHESDSAGLEPLSLTVGGHQLSQRRVLLDLEMNHRPILQENNNNEPQ